jgi:hypothetical protein
MLGNKNNHIGDMAIALEWGAAIFPQFARGGQARPVQIACAYYV